MAETALILGSNDRAALSVCRSLGRGGIAVDVLRFEPVRMPVEFSRFCRSVHDLGQPAPDVAGYLERLGGFLRERAYDYVLPVNDKANEILNAAASASVALPAVLGSTGEAYLRARNKESAASLAGAAGFAVPETLRWESPEPPEGLEYPVYVKPIYSAHVRDNYLHSFSVRKVGSARALADKLRDDVPRVPVLIQRPVGGHGVGLNLCALDGELCACGVTERVHEPRDGGGSSYRRTGVLTEELLEAARRIARELRWTGLMMIELKYDGSRHHVMEFNCRPWGSIELSVFSGVDFVRVLLDSIRRGGPPDAPVLPARQVFSRNLRKDVGWLLSQRAELARRPRIAAGWVASLGRVLVGRERLDFEQAGDPLPALNQFRDIGSRAARVAGERVRALRPEPRRSLPVGRDTRVLVVCRGNINRSAVAEYLLREAGVRHVRSAGTIEAHGRMASRPAERYMREVHGIDISAHRSTDIRTLGPALEGFEAIAAFDAKTVATLRAMYPELAPRICYLWELAPASRAWSWTGRGIADPHGKDAEVYRATFARIDEVVRAIGEPILEGARDDGAVCHPA